MPSVFGVFQILVVRPVCLAFAGTEVESRPVGADKQFAAGPFQFVVTVFTCRHQSSLHLGLLQEEHVLFADRTHDIADENLAFIVPFHDLAAYFLHAAMALFAKYLDDFCWYAHVLSPI
jgi:hypothetical protein